MARYHSFESVYIPAHRNFISASHIRPSVGCRDSIAPTNCTILDLSSPTTSFRRKGGGRKNRWSGLTAILAGGCRANTSSSYAAYSQQSAMHCLCSLRWCSDQSLLYHRVCTWSVRLNLNSEMAFTQYYRQITWSRRIRIAVIAVSSNSRHGSTSNRNKLRYTSQLEQSIH